jgi:hypothetical protein
MTVPTLHQPAGRQGQARPARRNELDLAVRRTPVTRFLFGLRPGQP